VGHASIVPAVKVRSTFRQTCKRGYAKVKRGCRLSGSGCGGGHQCHHLCGGRRSARDVDATHATPHTRRRSCARLSWCVRAPLVTNTAAVDSAWPSVPAPSSARSETATSSPSATRAHLVFAPSRLSPVASAAESAQLALVLRESRSPPGVFRCVPRFLWRASRNARRVCARRFSAPVRGARPLHLASDGGGRLTVAEPAARVMGAFFEVDGVRLAVLVLWDACVRWYRFGRLSLIAVNTTAPPALAPVLIPLH